MAIVHSYIRFSTLKQADGTSEARQVAGQDWAKRNGHTLSERKFLDPGRSSFSRTAKGKGKTKNDLFSDLTGKQKALRAFLEAIEDGTVKPGEILLVEAIDRLSRKGIRATQDLVNWILNRGVHIAILFPVEKVYRADDDNDIGGAIELAAFAYQAHVYSELLSGRLKSYWVEARKDARKDGQRFRKHKPGWLEWNEDKEDWDTKPGAQETIEFIFRNVVNGLGEKRLLGELARRKMKPMGRSGRWNSTFIGKLIRDPAVKGTWQPMMLKDGKLVPNGDPVLRFYPRIISDELFNQAQASRTTRYRNRGPNGDWVHLFSGMIHNARDGHPVHITTIMPRGKTYRRLVSYGHISRKTGADPLSLNYPDFERAVLSFIKEIKAEDLAPTDIGDESIIAAKRGELAGIEQQLAKLKKALVGGAEFDTLKDAIATLEHSRAKVKHDIDAIERDAAVSATNPHYEAKSILSMLDDAQGDELRDLRLKLRAVLGNLIESIWVLPFRVERKGSRGARIAAHIQLSFKSGVYRSFTMSDYVTQPVDVIIQANGKKIHFQATRGVAGAWETTSNPDMDLRNYRDKKLGGKLRKKLGN